jgi:hypothetical protein
MTHVPRRVQRAGGSIAEPCCRLRAAAANKIHRGVGRCRRRRAGSTATVVPGDTLTVRACRRACRAGRRSLPGAVTGVGLRRRPGPRWPVVGACGVLVFFASAAAEYALAEFVSGHCPSSAAARHCTTPSSASRRTAGTAPPPACPTRPDPATWRPSASTPASRSRPPRPANCRPSDCGTPTAGPWPGLRSTPTLCAPSPPLPSHLAPGCTCYDPARSSTWPPPPTALSTSRPTTPPHRGS